MKFYEGGLDYQYAKSLPIFELVELKKAAHKINAEITRKNS